jgi:hypothetical protein
MHHRRRAGSWNNLELMKRREFLKTSITATSLAGLATLPEASGTAQPAGKGGREFYELRVYRLKDGAEPALLHQFLEQAALPALNRLGLKPVGVFVEKAAPSRAVYMLVPHGSSELVATSGLQVVLDADYVKTGAKHLELPKATPDFDRIDSWLLLAFAGMPKLQLPAYCRERKPRLFELRTYESHSEVKGFKKVEMFNSGEIDAMREVGLGPIFYGQALIGANLPHLTYMTSGENEQEHKKHWDAFGKHPTWVKLKEDPQYADTVSKITKWILVPTPYSQI